MEYIQYIVIYDIQKFKYQGYSHRKCRSFNLILKPYCVYLWNVDILCTWDQNDKVKVTSCIDDRLSLEYWVKFTITKPSMEYRSWIRGCHGLSLDQKVKVSFHIFGLKHAVFMRWFSSYNNDSLCDGKVHQ